MPSVQFLLRMVILIPYNFLNNPSKFSLEIFLHDLPTFEFHFDYALIKLKYIVYKISKILPVHILFPPNALLHILMVLMVE